MKEIGREAAFGKLNRLGFQAIDSATKLCELRGNSHVELLHWMNQILQLQDSDLHRIVQAFQLNQPHLARDLTAALDRLPRGGTSVLNLSPHVLHALERGWVYATLMFRDSKVRTGHLVLGILKTSELRHLLMDMSGEFQRVAVDDLAERFDGIVGGSPEDKLGAMDGSEVATAAGVAGTREPAPSPQLGGQGALQRYSVDLTQRARAGEIDPVVGRDEEIRQIVDILMRRRQNNPILTGEAGVGKTAVVEGFALRIAAEEVPPPLQGVVLRALDIGAIQAGAGVRGEFEKRVKQVIEEVQASERPVILFIDEAHTLVGAGGAAGTGDAANLLKPALARGTLRTIAATTWAEYKQHVEKDAALSRRFQVVQIEEPGDLQATVMMRGIASTLERHHRVQILDEALKAAVQLSHRYIPARQLPDKAVSLLDTAAARIAIGQHALPAEIEDSRRRLESLETELAIIAREGAIGIDISTRETAARGSHVAEQGRLRNMEERWSAESALVDRILEIRAKLSPPPAESQTDSSDPGPPPDQVPISTAPDSTDGPSSDRESEGVSPEERKEFLHELKNLQAELGELQGESPLILPSVDAQVIAAVVADWTGIPVGRMVKNEIEAVLRLAHTLGERVIGQSHALEMVTRRVQTSRARLDNPGKPIGVFMLCGPSGVGKTETGLALAEALYGGEENIITINMSEFQEAHTVSTLKGAPPGYVGYGQGGVLTEAVRRRPYSVILLDEVEKAHPDVHEIFFQVFDKGHMEDAEGRQIDFRNTVILLTSNVGTDLIMNMCKDPALMPEPDGVANALHQPLLEVFPAALLGRLVVIPYYPLSDEMIERIIRLQLDRIEVRVTENQGMPFSYTDRVVDLIASRCTEIESGARAIDAILTNTVLPVISEELLSRTLDGKDVARIHIDVDDGRLNYAYD